MKIGVFMEGLTILRTAMKDGDGYNLCAEHDIIYVHHDLPLTVDQVKRLRELGWFQEGEDEDPPQDGSYKDGEGWACFT